MQRAPQGPPNSYSNKGDAGLAEGGLVAALPGIFTLICLGLGAASTFCWGGGGSTRDFGALFPEGLAERETGPGVVGAADAVDAMVARLLGAFSVAAATAEAAFLSPGDRRARVLTMLVACGWRVRQLCRKSRAPSDDGQVLGRNT